MSFLSSLGSVTLKREPAATNSTMAGCRPARLKKGRNWAALAPLSEASMIRGSVFSFGSWMPRDSARAACSAVISSWISALRSSSSLRCRRTEHRPFSIRS